MRADYAAILAVDVVGFSALMGADEAGTLRRVRAWFDDVLYTETAQHDGRVFKTMGDGALVVFPTARAAVACAISVQAASMAFEPERDDQARLRVRIGVNDGDLTFVDGDAYGDCVNVAARLEGMALPDGVLIAETTWEKLESDVSETFHDNGPRKFKNIARGIRVYSWPDKLPSPRSAGKPRLNVAGFAMRGGPDPDTGDVLGEEIRAHLSRLTGLEITQSAEDAHYVLEGSGRVSSGRSRVTVILTDVETNRQIWAGRCDASTDDAFDIADHCAPQIVMNARRHIASHDAERLRDRPLDELSKDDLMALSGVSFFNPTYAGWHGAGVIAEQALELDPDNFMALAMAAAGLGLAEPLYGLGEIPTPVLETALARVSRAVRANNRSDMLHSVRGGLLLYGHRNYAGAEAAARQSLAINPEYNMGWWMLASVQVFSGAVAEGAASAERSFDIAPEDPFAHLYCRVAGYAHLSADNPEEACAWFRRADQLAPGLAPNLLVLAAGCDLAGDAQGAETAFQCLIDADPEFDVDAVSPLPFSDAGDWVRIDNAVRAVAGRDQTA